jgi:hypothetical protein
VEDRPDGEAAPGEPDGELYETVQPAISPATAIRHNVFIVLIIFPPKTLEIPLYPSIKDTLVQYIGA